MSDGPIHPTCLDRFGFTPDWFDGYLYRKGDDIYISAIISKEPGCGHLSRLFETIRKAGFVIKVPCPFNHMREIVRRKGFRLAPEIDEQFGEEVETWVWP